MLKRVYISGANSGVGFELAKQYICRGDDVALFDIHFSDKTKSALNELTRTDQDVEFFASCINDFEALQTQINNAVAAIGKPELAIECSHFCFDHSEQLNHKRGLASQNFATVISPFLDMNCHLALSAHTSNGNGFSIDSSLWLLARELRQKLKASQIKISLICANKAHSSMPSNSSHIAKQVLRSLDKQKIMVIPSLQSRLSYIMSRYLPNWVMDFVMARLIKQQLIRTTR